MRKNLIFLLELLFSVVVGAQQKPDVQLYIEKYKQAAIKEMARSKVPASITLAQGILESAAGTSELSKNSNNHFGIKCKTEWTGKKYYHDDDAPQECFRVYNTVEESYADHSDFLISRPRYSGLFQLSVTDYKQWAHGLKEAGYATNPKYPSLLIGYIEEYKLNDFDQIGLALIEQKEKPTDNTAQAMAKAEHKTVSTHIKVKEHQHPTTAIADTKVESARQEFEVNGLRVVKAQENEDPFKVAFEYEIDLPQVLAFNDMQPGDLFKAGENIFLQPKKNRGAEDAYKVQAGENMRDIAQKTGVKLQELYTKNLMKINDQAYSGERLNLQQKRAAPPRSMSYAQFLASRNNNAVYGNVSENRKNISNINSYQVQKSDTIYSIAKKFNTSVEQIKARNNLEDNALKPGQLLVVDDDE